MGRLVSQGIKIKMKTIRNLCKTGVAAFGRKPDNSFSRRVRRSAETPLRQLKRFAVVSTRTFSVMVLAAGLFFGSNIFSQAQGWNGLRHTNYYPAYLSIPGAAEVVTNVLTLPTPAETVTAQSIIRWPAGTYWSLQGLTNRGTGPLPGSPFGTNVPVYAISSNQFVFDDRSVDYATMAELDALEAMAFAATNPPTFTACTTCAYDEQGLLWIEAPTNSLATVGQFNVVLHNTIQGQSYDVLTTPNLPGSWATELVVTGAVGTLTPVELPMDNRTNKFVRARTSVAFSFYLITPPMTQDVLTGDTVTFYVETGGNPNLTFQWTLNGDAIAGATNSSYTIYNVQPTDAGDYACIVSDGTNSINTAAGTLTVEGGLGDLNQMMVISARQNYTFKSGVTYYIGDQIQFYGKTTIEAGAVIKVDWYYNAGLVIMGTLDCQGEPYFPAVITSVDDDSIGE